MFHLNLICIFAYKRYLFTLVQGMDKFSNSSLRFKHFFSRRRKILEFLPRKGTAKFLCKFISGWHAWDIPLLDLGKIKKSNILLFPFFFFSCHSIITIEFVSYWKKYKENRFFYNYTLKFFSNKIISIIVQYITRLSSCRFNSTSLHPSLFTYICIYTLFYIFHP